MAAATPQVLVERFVKNAEPGLQPTLREARRCIREWAPGLAEAYQWGTPVYRGTRAVMYLAIQKGQVVLGFCHANEMPEFAGWFDERLSIVGKVRLAGPEAMERPGLREAVEAAAAAGEWPDANRSEP